MFLYYVVQLNSCLSPQSLGRWEGVGSPADENEAWESKIVLLCLQKWVWLGSYYAKDDTNLLPSSAVFLNILQTWLCYLYLLAFEAPLANIPSHDSCHATFYGLDPTGGNIGIKCNRNLHLRGEVIQSKPEAGIWDEMGTFYCPTYSLFLFLDALTYANRIGGNEGGLNSSQII